MISSMELYKICSNFFKHGFDPLNNIQKGALFVQGDIPKKQ